MTSFALAATHSPPELNPALHVLAVRAGQLADRVRRGQLPFIEAVDMAYSAAQWSGLTESVGDDAVQMVLADAFANVQKGK
jgi:hypothetical protein